MALLLLLLIGLPAVEIYLFITLGGALGAGWTVVLVFLTALWGLGAMRSQGLAVLAEAQAAQAAGQPPVSAAAHGLLVLSGGLMLLIPGFFTDALGFLLMLRPFRALLLQGLLAAFMPQIIAGLSRRPPRMRPGGTTGGDAQNNAQNSARHNAGHRPSGGQIIEGDYRIENEDEQR